MHFKFWKWMTPLTKINLSASTPMAKLVECSARDLEVPGSNPARACRYFSNFDLTTSFHWMDIKMIAYVWKKWILILRMGRQIINLQQNRYLMLGPHILALIQRSWVQSLLWVRLQLMPGPQTYLQTVPVAKSLELAAKDGKVADSNPLRTTWYF